MQQEQHEQVKARPSQRCEEEEDGDMAIADEAGRDLPTAWRTLHTPSRGRSERQVSPWCHRHGPPHTEHGILGAAQPPRASSWPGCAGQGWGQSAGTLLSPPLCFGPHCPLPCSVTPAAHSTSVPLLFSPRARAMGKLTGNHTLKEKHSQRTNSFWYSLNEEHRYVTLSLTIQSETCTGRITD